ncbi:MAG TPA: histidine kinase, partial [Cytophagales bacterium]|nr:histidine kinase [Cytophagales bacterium]
SVTYAFVGGLLNLGEAYRLAGRWSEAKQVMQRTLAINEALGSPIIEAYTLGNWGMVLRTEGDLAAAETKLEASLVLSRSLGDPYATAVYQAELGQTYLAMGKTTMAQTELQAALVIAQTENLKEQVRDISAVLVQLFQRQEEFAEAFTYQQLFQTYQDSLVNRENIQELERVKAGYEIDKRETEIGLLQQLNTQQRYVTWGLVVVVVLVALLALVLFRSGMRRKRTNVQLARQKEQLAQREQEKGLLLRELNHRVKNNLQMVTSLLSLQENALGDHPAGQAIASGKYRVEALSLIHRRLYREDHETA